MKRCWMGLLVVGCATAGPGGDEHLFKPAREAQQKPAAAPPKVEMTVTAEARIDPIGDSQLNGGARFAVDRGVVTMDLVFARVTPGQHAVALLDSCEGEHWNPTSASHGRFDSPPFHLGDVGNFYVNDEGKGSITFSTELWSIGTGLTNDVVDRAIAVYAGRDDFVTQPAGGSGTMIGCGKIDLSQLTEPAVSLMGRLSTR
jgi:Cu-Zn family superoxide dismutase